MKIVLPEIRPDARTPLVEAWRGIVRPLADRVAELDQTDQHGRAELARRKGQKPRPPIQPRVLEATKPKTASQAGGQRPGSAKRPKTAELTIPHEVPLQAADRPAGAACRGDEPYVVQDLVSQNDNTRALRARSDWPGGGAVFAPVPPGVWPVAGGHFGANLIAYILDPYHQAQVPEPLRFEPWWAYGLDISAGPRHPILTADQAVFPPEKGAILAAGLLVSSDIGTNDPGARHQGKNA